MPINKNKIKNNKKTSFLKILGILLTILIIGGLCCLSISDNQLSEEPIQEVVKKNNNQEITENNNQNNNEENIEKQPEIIINNEYIPVIDNLWLSVPIFLILSIVIIFFDNSIFYSAAQQFQKEEEPKLYAFFFAIIFFLFIFQVIFCFVWFILMFIFATLSKIWDRKHSWLSNVKKGFFRNRIYSAFDFWIFWLLDFVVNIIIAGLYFSFSEVPENVQNDNQYGGQYQNNNELGDEELLLLAQYY